VSSAADRRAWFERAVLEALPDLYSVARRLARDEADAEDLVADAVAKAWMGLSALRSETSFRGWIFRILSNTFMSRRRAEAARGTSGPLAEEAADGDGFSLFERLHQPFLLWWGNPEEEFLNRLLREDLERAVAGLPEAFRVTVVLADIQGFTYAEIAETLGVPIGTVRSRLARGRGLLQKTLWAHARDAAIADCDPTGGDAG
jgi:RNA polymerase sigma-70 factor (ECF subfamily)